MSCRQEHTIDGCRLLFFLSSRGASCFPFSSPHTGRALRHKAGLLAASVGLPECLITSGNDLEFIWAGKMNFTPKYHIRHKLQGY